MKKKDISKTNLISWITTILLISVSFTVFFIFEKFKDFENTKKILLESHIKYNKKNIENDLKNVVKYLSFQKSLPDEQKADSDISRKLLSEVKSIKFGNSSQGNVFIIDDKGKILMHPDSILFKNNNLEKLHDRNGKKPFQDLLAKVNDHGSGEVTYYQSTTNSDQADEIIILGRRSGEWGWTVCSPLFMGRIRRIVEQNQRKLRIDLTIELIYICLVATIISLIAIRFSYSVSKSIHNEIAQLLDYFKKTPEAEGELSEDSFQYTEFSFIAKSAKEQ